MQIFIILIWIIIGYIIGSIPWGLIIGKVFYKKDIRQYGSGNLGGTNAGRVLGKKAGIAVIVLDALKALILMVIARFIYPEAIAYTGAAVMVGHCFPLFANFKGGKGVACAFGYLLALGILGVSDIWFCFVYPILVFLLILGLSKMVSLSSMVSLSVAVILSFLTSDDLKLSIVMLVMVAFIIYRHKANIQRIINHKENKVRWIK